MGKKVHVVPHSDGWAVKKDGAARASSIHDTQKAAQEAAIPLAKQEKSEVVTHGRNGKIRDSDSYGNDPNPPKDKRR
jgi:uncharacterized protein YdaT